MLQHITDVTTSKLAQLVGAALMPDRVDIAGRRFIAWCKVKGPAFGRHQDHRQQLEQRALARTAFAYQCEFRSARDIETGHLEFESRPARVVDFLNVAERIDQILAQGSASSSRG